MSQTRRSAHKHLAMLWFCAAAVLGIFLGWMTIRNGIRLKEEAPQIWSWFLLALVPSLSMIIGAYPGTADDRADERYIEQSLFKLVFRVSFGYLILLAVLLCWIGSRPTFDGFQLAIALATLILTGIQGVVALGLGRLFVKQQ